MRSLTLPRRRTALAVVLCLCVVLAPAPAVADETDDEPEDDAEQIAEQLGDLVIHEYDYSDGQFAVEATWQGNTPETMTATEMIELDSGGSTEIGFEQMRLRPGERTELTIAAEIRTGDTAAVLISTDQSIEAGNAVVLQDGEPSDWGTINFENVLLAVGGTAVLSGGLVFVLTVKARNETNYEKRRIA